MSSIRWAAISVPINILRQKQPIRLSEHRKVVQATRSRDQIETRQFFLFFSLILRNSLTPSLFSYSWYRRREWVAFDEPRSRFQSLFWAWSKLFGCLNIARCFRWPGAGIKSTLVNFLSFSSLICRNSLAPSLYSYSWYRRREWVAFDEPRSRFQSIFWDKSNLFSCLIIARWFRQPGAGIKSTLVNFFFFFL